MDLVNNTSRFFPRKKEDLILLPLEELNCNINKYIIEKFLIVNCNYITRLEEYFFLDFNSKNQNISNESLLKIHKGYEIGGKYFNYSRKKINFLIFINKNEQKLKDLYKMLFYIYNKNPTIENSIDVTIIISSYTYITDFKPNCLLHDKPYHFYNDYCVQNKVEYAKFIKEKISKFKEFRLNMFDISSLDILIDLDIKPLFFPQFIVYDRNYKVLYKDNLFQETPDDFIEICKTLYTLISEPYDPNEEIFLGSNSPVIVSNFFDKIEKEISTGRIYKERKDFKLNKEQILSQCLKPNKSKKGKSCKIYFITKVTNLNYNLTISPFSKEVYIKPFVFQNSNNILPEFLYGTNYIKSLKLFHNDLNEYLSYTFKCAKSYIENTGIKCDIKFETRKKICNISFSERREFNVEYFESFENYYVPFNFRLLFKDKTKFFSINLFPHLNPNEEYKTNLLDINGINKEFQIKENEITILQYFRDDLYPFQPYLGIQIEHFKKEYPNIKFRYYMLILSPCEKIKNSILFEAIKKFLCSCQVDEVFIFTFNEFKKLTKYVTNSSYIYIYDRNKKRYSFEIIQGDKKRLEEWVDITLKYILNDNKWSFVINKQQYKLIKEMTPHIMKLYHLNSTQEVITCVLVKKKYFDGKNTEFIMEIAKWRNDTNLSKEIFLIQEKLKNIIGCDGEKIKLV